MEYTQQLMEDLYDQLKKEEDCYLNAIHSHEKYDILKAIRSRITEIKTRLNNLMNRNNEMPGIISL